MAKVVRKVTVDLWRTSKLKSKTFGIKKDEEYRAKSRQYTKGMELIGEIKEDGKDENGAIGIREDILKERLVIKAFTGSMNWTGTLEESIAREVIHSHVLGHKFPSMAIITPRYEYIVLLEKNEGGFGKKEQYHFTIIDKENRSPMWFVIKEKRISIGDDWEVYTLQDKKVADLDGKKFDIGGQWDVKVFSETLAKDHAFINTLVLFCASRKYEDQIEKRIGKIISNAKKGKQFELHREEMTMYENPRSLK